jgi:hypothetical protein
METNAIVDINKEIIRTIYRDTYATKIIWQTATSQPKTNKNKAMHNAWDYVHRPQKRILPLDNNII